METQTQIMDRTEWDGARDTDPEILPPLVSEVPVDRPWHAFPTSAISTREDITTETKKLVWAAFTATGCRVPSYEELEAQATRHAKLGIDPATAVLDTGILLPDHAYRKLEWHVKGLDFTPRRRTTRRKARA